MSSEKFINSEELGLNRDSFPTAYGFLCVASYNHSEAEMKLIRQFIQENKIPATILDTPPNTIEEKLKIALQKLNSEETKSRGGGILEQYDYAWIKRAIEGRMFLGSEKIPCGSWPQYIKYVKEVLGFNNIASKSVLAKYYKYVSGRIIPWNENNGKNIIVSWDYSDCMDYNNRLIKPKLREHRNKLIHHFLEIMREI